MEIVTIDEKHQIEYYQSSEKHYFCKIIEKDKSDNWADMIFGSKVEKGEDEIIKKAKAMIEMKKKFIAEFPEHK